MKSIDDRTMQQRLYDILKMNIKLARANNELNTITSDTFTSFEEATRSIDEYKQKDYEEEIFGARGLHGGSFGACVRWQSVYLSLPRL